MSAIKQRLNCALPSPSSLSACEQPRSISGVVFFELWFLSIPEFASQVASLAVFNLPLETLDKFIPAINAVTTKEVTAFAGKYVVPLSSLVIVGKASAFVDPLKKNFL